MSAVALVGRGEDGRALAPFGRRAATVAERREIGAYVVLAVEDAGGPAPDPGQFYMLAARERWGGGADERPFLPRAFSVMRARAGRLEFLLEDVGPGTARLCELEAGDGLWLLGPLGRGFTDPPAAGRPVLVGGGVGAAPLAILQDALGPDAQVLLGFRDAAHAAGAALLPGATVATDDGSVGHHGLVTDLLRQVLEESAFALGESLPSRPGGGDEAGQAIRHIYSCGPPPMLEAVRALCAEFEVPGQLALESPMACGYGACFGCVVPTRAGYVRLCVDGPVLDAAALEEVVAL